MMSLSTATEHARGMLEKGELADADAANIAIVRMMGVRLIRGRIPQPVRKALMVGVKRGELGRIVKNGLLPEAFFHPNARAHALDLRQREMRASVDQIKRIMATPS